MTRIESRLTPTQALAAATAYGWSVLPHDNGGFFAQSGAHQMVVVFNEDGSFRHAQVRAGDGEVPLFLEEGTVVYTFMQYGRPAISEGTSVTPVAGTTRYLCPLECGWHHDVPPPNVDRAIGLGAMADPAARDFQEAVSSIVRSASFAEADGTETALREHLETHTTEQFVRTIQGLRAEVAQWRGAGPVRPDEEQT